MRDLEGPAGAGHPLGRRGRAGGRDADSNACNTAAWLGALHGIDVWPKKWVETVPQANLRRMDLEQTGYDLIDKGLENGTVKFEVM